MLQDFKVIPPIINRMTATEGLDHSVQLSIQDTGVSYTDKRPVYSVGKASTRDGEVKYKGRYIGVLTVTPSGLVTVKPPEVLKTYDVDGKLLKDNDYVYTTIHVRYRSQTKIIVVQVLV